MSTVFTDYIYNEKIKMARLWLKKQDEVKYWLKKTKDKKIWHRTNTESENSWQNGGTENYK